LKYIAKYPGLPYLYSVWRRFDSDDVFVSKDEVAGY
jgi:hypothetical protein